MLLPRPASATPGVGSFALTSSTTVSAPESLADVTMWLQSELRPPTGFKLLATVEGQGDINLTVAETDEDGTELGAEAYRLSVTESGVTIVGGSAAGVRHGCQTLLQLLPPDVYRKAPIASADWTLPVLEIRDAPRFAWRGVMLDVARHFMPKHDVLRFIDLAAMHKLNVLHFHLTEDQGWRIEIKKYPKLTEVGSWRKESQVGAQTDCPGDGRPHGGFYTQDDIREIVAYATARGVEVIPEIEMPGHVQAAIAAYPELGVTGEALDVGTRWGIIDNVANAEQSTVDFFCDVLDEVIELFPSRYIHVGGDECPRVQWENDPRTQELMKARGITREADVQTWFMQQIGKHLSKRGRIMVGWDELLEGDLPAGTVISSWRGMTGAITAARRGYDVVSCPFDVVYLDYRYSENPEEPIPVAMPLDIADVYAFEPVPAELSDEEAKHILGGQANVWTEHMDSPRTVDFFTYPRLSAIAEVLWSQEKDSLDGLQERLGEHLKRLDAVGVEYRDPSGTKPWQTRPGIPGRPTSKEQWKKFEQELVADIKE